MRPLFLLAALLLTALPALAQNNLALRGTSIVAGFTGQKSGAIKGEVRQKGRDGLHTIIDFEYGVNSPRDGASGLATGKRQHRTVRLLKRVTPASPILFQALVSNESFPQVRLDFWETGRPGMAGAEILGQVITLQNASLASWRQLVHPDFGLVEELTFTFQKITIEHKTSGATAQDDWGGERGR